MTKRIMVFFSALLLSTAALAELLPVKDIFSTPVYQSMKMNPAGNYILAKAYLDGKHQLLAFQGGTLSALEIFEVKPQKNSDDIEDYGWVDEDTAYVRYSLGGKYRTIKIIDFSFKTEDFDISEYEIEPYGFVVSPDRSRSNSIFFAKSNKKGNGFDLLQVDLNKIKNASEKEQRVYLDSLVKMNGSSHDNAKWFHMSASGRLDMFREDDEDESRYYIFDKNAGKWVNFRTVSHEEDKKKSDNEHLDVFVPIQPSGNDHIFVISNEGRDRAAVMRFNFRTKTFDSVIYESDIYDINSAAFDSVSGNLISVYYSDRGVLGVKYLDTFASEINASLKARLGSESVFVASKSADEKKQVLYSTDSAKSSRFYYFDQNTSVLKLLQDRNPALHKFKFSRGEYVSFKNEEGQLIEAFLSIPKNPIAAHSPLVVMPHGGPLGVRDSNEFDPEVQYLVSKGYAVLRVNFRGSYGYGKNFVQAGRGELGRGIERDINQAADLVVKDSRIDVTKVCIYGQSYGGYSSLMSVLLHKDRYKCAISAFGIADLPLLFQSVNLHLNEQRSSAIRWVVGDFEKDYDKLMDYSPVYQAGKIDAPILLIAGSLDETASSEHTNRMKYMLKHFKKDVDAIVYATGHGHRSWLGDRHQYLSIVDFLDKKLNITRVYAKEDYSVLAEEYYLLGEMHRTGDYANKDKVKAEKFLRLAYQYGSQDAPKSLRTMGVYDFDKNVGSNTH